MSRWIPGRTLMLAMVAAAALWPGLPAVAQDAGWITHEPVSTAPADRAIVLTAQVEGGQSEANVFDAQVFFRSTGSASWHSRDLEISGGRIEGRIPAGDVTTAGLEYYIMAQLRNGERLFYPTLNPDGNPVVVNVVPSGEELAIESGVRIISPNPDKVFAEPSVLVIAAFDPSVYEVDPKKVILRFNGRNVTKRATVTRHMISAIIENVSDGRHRIDLLVRDKGREKLLTTWLFTYESPFDEEGARRELTYTGTVGTSGRTQQYNGFRQSILTESVNVRMEYRQFRAQAYGRFTSEEHGSLQPQHRFRVQAGWDFLQLGLGDITPRYSDLILNGLRVRGVEMRLKYGMFTVKGVYGQTKRAIAGSGYAVAGTDSTLVSDPGDPPVYDTYTAYSFNPGTYRRDLSAMRMTVGRPYGLQWGLTVMKVRDDTSSIGFARPYELHLRQSQGQPVSVDRIRTPKDNMVIGSDLQMKFDRGRITAKAEAALSLYNSNIAVRPLDDAESLRNIIVVNQFFQPLPEDGLPEGDEDLDQNALVNSIIRNALSWKANLRFRYWGHDVQAGYRMINRSYNTLGNPTLATDRGGFYIKDRVRLFDSKLYLDGGYRLYNDNVSGKSERTRWENQVDFGISYYTPQAFPDITFRVRQYLERNNGEATLLRVSDDYYLLDDRLSEVTATYTAGVSQLVDFQDTRSRLYLNYSTTVRADEYDPFGDLGMNLLSFTANTEYGSVAPMSTLFTFSKTGSVAMEELIENNYTTYALRLNYYLFDRALIPYLHPKILLGEGYNAAIYPQTLATGADPATTVKRQTTGFIRYDYAGGFEWRFMESHYLGGKATITSYVSNNKLEYFDGHSEKQDDLVNRDDYSLMFSYMYKF